MVRKRVLTKEDGTEQIIYDRQLRVWCCMLYPDNPAHEKAIQVMKLLPYTCMMLHDNTEGNKPHYHIYIQRTFYLFTLLDKFGLSIKDAHLFKSLAEITHKGESVSFNSWALYQTHIKYPNKEKYDASLFEGGLSKKAQLVVIPYTGDEYIRYMNVIDFIESFYKKRQYLSYHTLIKYMRKYHYEDLWFKKYGMLKTIVEQNNRMLENHIYIDNL